MTQMLGDAHVEESETGAESYPIIIRSYEPVADLDDRLQRIFAGRASVAGSFVAAWWGFTGLAAVAWKRWWGQR
jgi:hypothetical protein